MLGIHAMEAGQVTLAHRVRPGDDVLDDGDFVRIATVRRARGRKPKIGENLELVADDGRIVKRNSTAAVRVRRTY